MLIMSKFIRDAISSMSNLRSDQSEIKIGDTVRVKSYEVIREISTQDEILNHPIFAPGMRELCGEQRVVTNVTRNPDGSVRRIKFSRFDWIPKWVDKIS